ncbi:MAG: hypothetical protein U0X91_31510 [Spirosomataceae bacterium]
MISTAENNLLFDDLSVLENRFGIGSLKVTSVNANCDCAGDSNPSTHKDSDTDQIPATALTTA